ncbi:bifunctional DNA-formamidopyrimidine glycosylase/DNA-(apurinic or apyrimidinic site) lyase [Geotalea sp. SG265]|uniref:bifunctional DNA-formamidopyrimidine glycosylase/DNA-(apurinic or apyrimidinic site) lyase n=1 Tax=Geotalea sp. SG265 TaxID=2922867 RepID=UPI001FAE909F|nr:bifunctional DNA-formamidopyrimidine glycosylase/DNA-(apurinic or apyrimidinic site) lyase [Geotalea sp. SG265]
MPELPEVETIRSQVMPHLVGRKIVRAVVRTLKLRHHIPPDLNALVAGQEIISLDRRGKYLLLRCTRGTIIVHLGMTGTLFVAPTGIPAAKHDHLDLELDDGYLLRFRDPRRFGTIAWTTDSPLEHPLLALHGPEPLGNAFSGGYLLEKSARRKIPVKQLLMDQQVVAGIGNIYAGEALFRAGIRPQTPASSLSRDRCYSLAQAIREVIAEAVKAGKESITGTVTGDAPSGYFPYRFQVYGRGGLPCLRCGTAVETIRLGGRSTYFCPHCQK